MRNNLRWIAIIIVIGLVVVVGYFEINKANRDRIRRDKLQELSNEIIVLESERNECRIELEKIDSAFAKELDGKAVISFIMTDISESFILEDIYPAFSQYETNGLLAVTDSAYPGMEGCISLEKTTELMYEGWDLCYLLNEDTTFEEWENMLQTVSNGFELSDSIESAYIPLEVYQTDESRWNDAFVEAGISYLAIGNGNTTYKTDETIFEKPWKISACDWMNPNVFTFMKRNSADFNTFVFLVGGREDSVKSRKFSAYDFDGMISSYRSYKDSNVLLNMNLKEAYEYRMPLAEAKKDGCIVMDPETQKRKEALEQRIEELNPLIKEQEDKVSEFISKERER